MKNKIRFGLACLFRDEPIKFRTTTARALRTLDRKAKLTKLSGICLANSESLKKALKRINQLNIRAFRVMSQIFPIYTHPEMGYSLDELPESCEIRGVLREVLMYGRLNDIRLSMHPDQFIVLNSPKSDVVENAVRELKYQSFFADLVGVEVINIHLGGVYGDKTSAIERFIANFANLAQSVKSYISLENDDKSYTPSDLLPISEKTGIPIVYDVHHHRCNPDGLSVSEATELCAETWLSQGREPYFHISSPREGWLKDSPRSHADYINPNDFPDAWRKLSFPVTIDIEAKAKELAIKKLDDIL